MFGISAREAGTGKGVLASLAAIMTTGRRAPETPWPSHTDEQRKVITSVLIGGEPLIILDNISDVLDSPPLCVLLTAETWSDRVLGQSRQLQLPASVLVVATGNNLKMPATYAGGFCRSRWTLGARNPELRKFRARASDVGNFEPGATGCRGAHHPVELSFCRRARRSLRAAGLIGEWCRTVCGASFWIGEPDPRDAMAANSCQRSKKAAAGQCAVRNGNAVWPH